MNITLNMVIDTFNEYTIISRIPLNENRSFRWASLLPVDKSELKIDILYLIDLADPGSVFDTEHGYSYLCVNSSGILDENDLPDGCMMIREIKSLTKLMQIIQARFDRLHDWQSKLDEIIIKDGSYQDLLDASEYVLGNPIQILDASYKLLAATSNIRSDDEMDVKLIESGYHQRESLQRIQKSGILKVYKEELGVIVNPPGHPNKYGTVSRWFWDSGMPVIHILMVCKCWPPTPALIDCFQILTDILQLKFVKAQSQDPQSGRIYDPFMHDLIFGDLKDESEINERAKVADVPVKGIFNVMKIILQDNNDWLIKRVYTDIMQALPGARVINHRFEIVVFNSFELGQITRAMEEVKKRILPIIENFNAFCGVSSPFEHISEMKRAFYQSAKALSLGKTISESSVLSIPDLDDVYASNGGKNIFEYDDLLIYYTIALGIQNGEDIFTNSTYCKLIKNMWFEDSSTHNDNCRVLFTYLACERKATKTGEILHMHRNNVIYRINKIQESIGMDLDDYWTREKLLFAFHLLKLGRAIRNE